VLGISPWELRLKNANRVGDTTPNRVTLKDPSTVPVVQALAERNGVELPAKLRAMTNAPRSGEELPEHLVAQQNLDGGES
jgi:hypothetical protein